MKYHINPENPLLFRHFEVVRERTGLGGYIKRTSTAVNEKMFPLDFGPEREPLARKSWWKREE